MRLFLALRPPAPVLEHLESALEGVRSRAGRVLRWTEAEQRHLTLAFHPDVPAGAVDDVVADAARIAAGHAPPSLHLAGAGQFAHRTLWMGVGEAVRALSVYRGPDWTAEAVEVVASHLGEGRSGGPAHEVLARVPLGR